MFCFSLIFTLEVLGETAVINKYQARNLLRYFLHCNIYTCDTLNTGLLAFKLTNSSHTFAENTSWYSKMASESVILGMGNPLLDISAVVKHLRKTRQLRLRYTWDSPGYHSVHPETERLWGWTGGRSQSGQWWWSDVSVVVILGAVRQGNQSLLLSRIRVSRAPLYLFKLS